MVVSINRGSPKKVPLMLEIPNIFVSYLRVDAHLFEYVWHGTACHILWSTSDLHVGRLQSLQLTPYIGGYFPWYSDKGRGHN